MSNPGTAASPWKTLAEVTAAKKFNPGDRIFLRRGYHGSIFITGHNSADVFILPEPGHTPTAKVITLFNASHWNIKGLTISGAVVPANHPDKTTLLPQTSGRMINIDTQENENSHYNTFSEIYGYTAQIEQTVGWNHHNWNVCRGAPQNYGKFNTIENCHWYVVKGAMLNGFHSNNFTYRNNTHENFVWDAMQQKADYGLFENNLILNYYIVDSNHNDGFQSYGGAPRKGTILRNNIIIAFTDPNQPYRYGSSTARGKYCHGIGMFDGFYEDWTIEGNHVFIDSITGIWIRGAKRLKITNNIVVPCSSGSPRLVVGPHKNGSPSVDITNTGNIVRNSPYGVDWPRKDVRPTGSKDLTAPSKPTGLKATVIPGYGVDLHWNASTDNIRVRGYDIFRNGVRVGRKRVGTNFFHPSVDTTGMFSVRAFDFVGNTSPLSDAVGSVTPDPVVDTVKPTIPAGLAATAESSSVVKLSWTPSSDNIGVAGYDIYRGNTKVGSSSTAEFTNSGLVASTQYQFKVKARDFAGNQSDFSTTALVTTLPGPPAPPSANGVYQAELAALLGAVAVKDYVDFKNNSGDFIEWTVPVSASSAGSHKLTFQYALADLDGRRLAISVNGVIVNASFLFADGASWTTWKNSGILNIQLNAGENKIRLSTNGENGPNVNSLTVIK